MKFLKKYWYFIIFVLLLIPTLLLLSHSVEKSLVILLLLISWLVIGLVKKDFLFSSILLLIVTLPLNLTFQINDISDPYVYGIFSNYLVPTVSILDISVILLLVSLLFRGLKWKKEYYLLLLFLLFTTFQFFFVNSPLSIFNSIRLVVYIFTFYNLKDLFKKDEYLKPFLYLSLIQVVLQGVIAFLQFRNGVDLSLQFLGESNIANGMPGSSSVSINNILYLRGYGTFPHPNVLSGWFVFNILLGWRIFNSLKKRRDLCVLLMILSLLGLVFTFSRIGYFVGLLVFLIFTISNFVNINGKSFLSSIFVLAYNRFIDIFNMQSVSVQDRLSLVRVSISMLKEDLLIGVGMGNFVKNINEGDLFVTSGILLLQPVHNIFLLGLNELGIIGLLLILTIFFVLFFRKKKINLLFISVLLTILIIGFFDHYLITLPQGVVMMIVLLIL